MSTNVNAKRLGRRCAIVALVVGLGFSASSISQVAALPDPLALEHLSSTSSVQPADKAAEARQAIKIFLRGMAEGDAETVWMYASEEDQAAFETEDAVLTAFVGEFPVLAEAENVKFDSFREEGDTPFWVMAFKDDAGVSYRAEVGLWRDDAGDWKVVSCEVYALSDLIASL